MKEQQKNIEHVRNPAEALKAAIATLEQFAIKNNAAPVAHVADLSVKNGHLVPASNTSTNKTIGLVRDFIAASVSKKARDHLREQKVQVQNAVLQAIDVIKRHHLLIAKYEDGSQEEQQLAASTLAAISRYNAVVDRTQQAATPWSTKLTCFLYEHSGLKVDDEITSQRIELPNSTPHVGEASTEHVFAPIPTTPIVQSDVCFKQEMDAIRMKAGTLLKSHGIRFKTMAEAIQTVRTAPIHATVDTNSKTATLCLTLDVLPGTTIKVRGSFKRDMQTHSIPISDSFQLVYKSFPTGFPHPSQHTGWALDGVLIPAYPHRLDQLPLFRAVYEQKKATALALLPDGHLIERAKFLLDLKQQVFMENLEENLKGHRLLIEALINAAPNDLLDSDSEIIIEAYFEYLKTLPDAFNHLSCVYARINEYFLQRPYTLLQNTWLAQKNPALFSQDPAVVYRTAIQILNDERLKATHELSGGDYGSSSEGAFVCYIGNILGMAGQAIMMQHLSETLQCAPPMLNDFEMKIQTISFLQLMSFLEELAFETEVSTPEDVKDKLKQNQAEQLSAAISTLNDPSFDTQDSRAAAIVQELEVYFNTRYYTSLYNAET